MAKWYSVEVLGEEEEEKFIVNEFICSVLSPADVQQCIIAKLNNMSFINLTEIDEDSFFPFEYTERSPYLYVKEKGDYNPKQVYYRYFVWAKSYNEAIKQVEKNIEVPHE